ncbi:MAG: RNA 3'-terminal phosphate cyclase [Victivallales bacterium]|nr:RNA 3'-terminal phosphate cyclase [Victivallales bacterium]
MITIDGSFGEGGGQILRTSLSLAAITGTEVRLENLRANRPKPGLMRQHLACAKAVAEICGGELDGAELRSQTITLKPGMIRGGEYNFAIGSAGSTILLAQTVLPVLLFADAPSTVVIEGGTYNDKAPAYDFFEEAYLPCLRKMGVEADVEMKRVGFYPAGGGRIELNVKPVRAWRRLSLVEHGNLQDALVTAVGSGLDESILVDELQIFQTGLEDMMDFWPDIGHVESAGPGNVLIATLRYENLTEVFSVCGSLGVSRKSVAKRVAGFVRQYLSRNWVVGQFLADQLMLPMALGAGGDYLTGRPTPHSETNRAVIQRFIDVNINFKEEENNNCIMEIEK